MSSWRPPPDVREARSSRTWSLRDRCRGQSRTVNEVAARFRTEQESKVAGLAAMAARLDSDLDEGAFADALRRYVTGEGITEDEAHTLLRAGLDALADVAGLFGT